MGVDVYIWQEHPALDEYKDNISHSHECLPRLKAPFPLQTPVEGDVSAKYPEDCPGGARGHIPELPEGEKEDVAN